MIDQPQTPHPESESTQFITAVSHLYRAEMNRMSVWRQRLDVTSNWAIILATALTTFTLGAVEVPHYTLLLGLALVMISILLEGRRYRHLHHSKWRLYLLESGFFANILRPARQSEARSRLAPVVGGRSPSHPLLDQLVHRYAVTVTPKLPDGDRIHVRGVGRKAFHPPDTRDQSPEFYARLHIGEFIPPWFVAATAVLFLGSAAILGLTCPSAEKLEDWSIHYHRRRVDIDRTGTFNVQVECWVHPELHEVEKWTDDITASASAAVIWGRGRFQRPRRRQPQ